MPELWDGLAAEPLPAAPNMWPGGGAPAQQPAFADQASPQFWQSLMQGMPAPEPPSLWPQAGVRQPEMRSYKPSQAERLKGGAADFFSYLGADQYNANKLGDIVKTAAEIFPPTGIPLAVNEMQRGIEAGSPGQTALGAVGAIPGAKPAAGIIKTMLTHGAAPQVGELAARSAVSTARPLVEGLTGAFAPAAAPVRGGTRTEIGALQKAELSPEDKQALDTLSQKYPEFKDAARWMHPTELKPMLTEANAENISRLSEVLPRAAEMTSVAKMGTPKQGWYRGSTQALIDVFGKDDAPRFAALLAATSPQNSVEMNLLNSLSIWKNWTAAGRPTDPQQVKAIMGQSVTGAKGEDSVLPAWINNTHRALSSEDPLKVVLSGPKVDSFFHNLADDVHRVTNDAWMANVTGMNQDLFRGPTTAATLAAGNPGVSPAYAATSALVRNAGQRAGMLPSEGQETIWSVAKPMMEAQSKHGIPAREVLQRGLLTEADIRGTPDFATLLKDPGNRQILEQAGYGSQVDALRPYINPNATPTLTNADQNNILNVAKRLENLKDTRERESRISTYMIPKKEKPDTTIANATWEGIPGLGTGLGEYFINQPLKTRESYSNAIANIFSDIHGRSILHRDAGLNAMTGQKATGAYIPPGGPPENQPVRNFPFEVPLQGRDRMMRSNDEKMAEVANMIYGSMTGQHGTPYHATTPSKMGTNLFVPFEDKAPLAGMQNVTSRYAGEPLAFADTGKGTSVLNFTPNQIARQKADEIAQTLGGDSDKFVRTRSVTQGNTMADLEGAFKAGRGSRQVATKVDEQLDRLTPKEFAKLDSPEFRRAAGDLLALYEQKARTTKGAASYRDDSLEYLKLLRDKGLAGLKAGLADPNQLLPVLGALGLTGVLAKSLPQQGGEASQ